MRVILKTDVPNLGRAGEIKEVKNGYARNYLIPRNLVMSADARSEKQRAFLESVQKRKVEKRKKTAAELAANLNGKEIRITMKTGEEGRLFGSVTNIQIARALETEGFLVDKKAILLDEPIKALGEYNIAIKFYEGVQSVLKVYVQDENGNTSYVAPAPAEATLETPATE